MPSSPDPSSSALSRLYRTNSGSARDSVDFDDPKYDGPTISKRGWDSDPVVQELSRGFGRIERAINEMKLTMEKLPLDKEVAYDIMDGLADHVSEAFRHIVDGDPMVRWRRRV